MMDGGACACAALGAASTRSAVASQRARDETEVLEISEEQLRVNDNVGTWPPSCVDRSDPGFPTPLLQPAATPDGIHRTHVGGRRFPGERAACCSPRSSGTPCS